MNYKEVGKERLIERIVEKNKLIQKLKLMKIELNYQACTDNVTGVLNRSAEINILETTLYEAARQRENFIIFADIDDFKKTNDTFGHNQGDKLLKNIGNILRVIIRKVDTVFRIGCDEFVIIFPSTTIDEAKAICSRICRRVDELEENKFSEYS